METHINELARHMVMEIANKHIKAETKWEGMSKQRWAYLKAQKMLKPMLKRLFVEYRKVIKDSQET